MEMSSRASGERLVPKRRKAFHSKSRTGCITCRARRVKCDESKPLCTRCHQANRQCEGYADIKVWHFVPKAPRQVFLMNEEETRAFQFYLEKTSQVLATQSNRLFWLVTVPRIFHAQPIIRSVVFTLAASHRLFGPFEVPNREQEFRFGVVHYQKALILASRATDDEVGTVVLASLLLGVADYFAGRNHTTWQHAASGEKIAKSFFEKHGKFASGPSAEIIRETLPVLRMTKGEKKIQRRGLQITLWKNVEDRPPSERESIPFGSLDEALQTLKDLMHVSLFPRMKQYFDPSDNGEWARDAQKKLENWSARLSKYRESNPKEQLEKGYLSRLTFLYVHGWTLGIHISFSPCAQETVYESMITSVTLEVPRLIMAIETTPAADTAMTVRDGIFEERFDYLAHLFTAATKIRNPRIRPETIRLMRMIRDKEQEQGEIQHSSIWCARVVIAISEQIFRIEERSLSNVTEGTDIPESNRIRVVDIVLDDGHRKAIMRYIKHPYIEDSPTHDEEILNWPWDVVDRFEPHQQKSIRNLLRTSGYQGLSRR